MRHSSEHGKVRRRDKTSGGHFYINSDILCKSLTNAGIDCGELNLKFKASACRDGKRAKIIIHVTRK